MVRPRQLLRAQAARTGRTTAPRALALALATPLCLGWSVGVTPAAAGAVEATAATAGSGAGATGGVRTVAPAPNRAPLRTGAPTEPDTAPLRVRIAALSKASLPARGSIRIRGTVTNRSDETWTTIRLYSFAGTKQQGADVGPMTSPTELAEATEVPYDAAVGDRVVNVEGSGLIETLAPGETAPYVIRVPVDELGFPEVGNQRSLEPGAYWFGVQALGQGGSSTRDTISDGRARTFLPYVPRSTDPVPAALVVPLTHAVLFDSDGSVADEERWEQRLSPGGRLRDLLTLGSTGAASGVPITWLVDPALIDAIGRLAGGNEPRTLAATPDAADPDAAPDGSEVTAEPGASATPDASGATEPADGAGSEDAGVPETPVAVAARGWLDAAADVFAAGEVATLPYGNPDITATRLAEPALLDLALAQRSSTLAALGTEGRPVLAAPGGYVDTTLAAAAPEDQPLLVSDRFLAAPGPGVARLADRQLIVTSSGAAAGSPGPGRSVTAVGLRQRLLAEAAVRALPERPGAEVAAEVAEEVSEPDVPASTDAAGEAADPATVASARGEPLVVVLPTAWDLDAAEEFFDGLDPGWVDFGDLADATSSTVATTLTADDLVDTPDRRRRELEAETFEAVRDLIDTGETLQRVLVDNTRLAARVTEQALSGLSYSVRRQQREARGSLALSSSWLDDQLAQVQITASAGVTLSGDSGTFVVTLTNDLDVPVRVSIASTTDEGLEIDPVEPLDLAAKSRTSVLLNATTTTSRVHNVTLMVTDAEGVPLGASEALPIRSVLVSGVIWVIIGVGVGTLFLAIGLRLRRRLLAARRGESGPA